MVQLNSGRDIAIGFVFMFIVIFMDFIIKQTFHSLDKNKDYE